ncbi:transposase [Streptomyces sp. MRC013]|uniref:transposase n=1 Tax=Streptomyces sp. MRC013 TaxID=2898276 RepID=UPI002025B9DA|nr:transposase [Streptomyces sp. MRC013]URM89403.1 transposase [Streptomyces sp. MRC013]
MSYTMEGTWLLLKRYGSSGLRLQLGGPIVLVWDNARIHLVPPLKAFFEASGDWLAVFRLPTYASDLTPRERVWSLVKRNLKQTQYRPHLIDGCLAGTDLIMNG